MRLLASARPLPKLAILVWSGAFVCEALRRWRFDRICDMSCGPFWEPELIGPLRAQMDWQTPLVLACLPLVILVVVRTWRCARSG